MQSLAFFFLSGSYWWYFLVVSFPSFPVLVFWMQHPPSLTEGTNFSIFAGYCCCYFVYSEFTTSSELAALLVCLLHLAFTKVELSSLPTI